MTAMPFGALMCTAQRPKFRDHFGSRVRIRRGMDGEMIENGLFAETSYDVLVNRRYAFPEESADG